MSRGATSEHQSAAEVKGEFEDEWFSHTSILSPVTKASMIFVPWVVLGRGLLSGKKERTDS